MTDNEIMKAIENYFEIEFENFGGDNLDECLNGTGEDYERALELLTGSSIEIRWA